MVIFDTFRNFRHGFQHALKFSTWFSTHFKIFDMVFNTVFNMVHTIGEFLCLKCVENILKKHFEISPHVEICNAC